MITSLEEWVESILKQSPWLLAVCAGLFVASCFWVFAPPAYLLACAGIGALWFAIGALGAYLRRPHRFPLNFIQIAVVIFGFMLVDNHLRAGGFFGSNASCVPQGFNTEAATLQGVSLGLGVGLFATLAIRRWLVALVATKSD